MIFAILVAAAASEPIWMPFCRTSNVSKLPWSDDRVDESLALVEAALRFNCNTNIGEGHSTHSRVFFVKTHKTASSTLERVIALKGLKVGATFAGRYLDRGSHYFASAHCPAQLAKAFSNLTGLVDMAIRHVFQKDFWPAKDCPSTARGRWLEEVYSVWRELMDESVAVVIPTREAKSHLESALHFFNVDHEKFHARRDLWNPMAQDLHLYTMNDVEALRDVFPPPYNAAAGLHVIVFERLYESLVVLGHRLGWQFQDLIAVPVFHRSDQHMNNQNLTTEDKDDDQDAAVASYREAAEGSELAVDRALYAVFEDVLDASREAVEKNLNRSINDEVHALRVLTENIVALAFPVVRLGLKRRKGRSEVVDGRLRDLPLLSVLCDPYHDGEKSIELAAATSPHSVW